MAKTKGDLVLKALRKAGLYSNATLTDADPQAIEDAINDLEDMMAAWQAKGIELGYQFADTENGIMPLPDDDSGIPAWANDGVALKLAVQVCMDNVIQPSDALLTAADSAYQTICIALTKIPPLERRNDMPRGSGNKSAFTWNRFYIEKDDPSTSLLLALRERQRRHQHLLVELLRVQPAFSLKTQSGHLLQIVRKMMRKHSLPI